MFDEFGTAGFDILLLHDVIADDAIAMEISFQVISPPPFLCTDTFGNIGSPTSLQIADNDD